MVVMKIYHLYAQACEERKRVSAVMDLKHHILAQDEYEANGITGVMVLTKQQLLLLKRQRIKSQTRQIDNARPLVPLYIEKQPSLI